MASSEPPTIKETAMNIKLELVTLVVRTLSNKTTLLPQASNLDNFISTLLTGETVETRTAKQILAETERLASSAKRLNTNRKFKKITQHF